MKIGIDISNLDELSKKRGIGFYTQNLISSLNEYTNAQVSVIVEKNEDIKIDIIHYPFFDFFKFSLPLIKKNPTIVTIHDVIPLLFPKAYPPGVKGNIHLSLQKISLKNVSAILTDSESSKKDIVKVFNINSEKIFPIHLASDESFKVISDSKRKNEIYSKYELADKFVIYVGDVNWNKNLFKLTEAALDADIDIYLIGKAFEDKTNLNHPEKKSYKKFLDNFESNPKVHILGFVPQEDLVIIMNLATMLLLPSLYEGFGLPILEAQSCGLPVITSNISSMPEVGGEGALFVDPNNKEDVKKQIKLLLNNEKERIKLIEKGFENTKKFSWKETALNTYKVYEKVLS